MTVTALFCLILTADEIKSELKSTSVKIFEFPDLHPRVLVGESQDLEVLKNKYEVELIDAEWQDLYFEDEHLKEKAIQRYSFCANDILIKDVETIAKLLDADCYPESAISGSIVNKDGIVISYSLEYPELYFILEGCASRGIGKPKPRVGCEVPLTGRHQAIAKRILKLITQEQPKEYRDASWRQKLKQDSARYLDWEISRN